jgi:ABC-type transport system involved in multi-copper enzyme maturation permease subunit
LKAERDTLVGLTVIAVALILIFLLVIIWQPPSSAAAIVATLPFSLLQLWLIASGFYLISNEWREQTIALLGSMPVKSWSILIAKMLTAWTNFFYLALLFGLGALLVIHVDIPAATEGTMVLIILNIL